jgi:cytochrome P450
MGDRPALAEDYGRLKLTWMCFAEGLRLFPPVWVTARTAARGYEYRGFRIPQGSILLASQASVHRDLRFWEAPEEFAPELHFSEAARAARLKMSFFPFAAGSRQCIGEGLAWMEGVFVLAVVARDWRLTLPEGASEEIAYNPAISLRPKAGVPVVVQRR